jgi:hypothetical protein
MLTAPFAVAFADITTVLEVFETIVVPLGIPAPSTNIPTSNSTVLAISVNVLLEMVLVAVLE